MFGEVVALPPGRVQNLSATAVLTSDDIKAMGVCEAIKPVRDVKRPLGGIVDCVGPRSSPKEGTRGPRGDVASDWEFDWPAMLFEIGKLLSHISKRTVMRSGQPFPPWKEQLLAVGFWA